MRNLRPCIGQDLLLRVDGRLENADLPVDTKHPTILPRRYPLTRLIVLSEHCRSGHAGPACGKFVNDYSGNRAVTLALVLLSHYEPLRFCYFSCVRQAFLIAHDILVEKVLG